MPKRRKNTRAWGLLLFSACLSSCAVVPLGLSSDDAIKRTAHRRGLSRIDSARALVPVFVAPAIGQPHVVRLPRQTDTVYVPDPTTNTVVRIIRPATDSLQVRVLRDSFTIYEPVAIPCPPVVTCPDPKRPSRWRVFWWRTEGFVGGALAAVVAFVFWGVWRKFRT